MLPWLSIRAAEIKERFTCERERATEREKEERERREQPLHSTLSQHSQETNVKRSFDQHFQHLLVYVCVCVCLQDCVCVSLQCKMTHLVIAALFVLCLAVLPSFLLYF